MQRLPVSIQRQILKLEQQVFNLKQKLAKMKDKYEKQIAELKASPPPILNKERRKELIAQRERILAAEESARAHRGGPQHD